MKRPAATTDVPVGSRWVNRKRKRVAQVTGTTEGWIEYRYVEGTPKARRATNRQAVRLRPFLEDFEPESP